MLQLNKTKLTILILVFIFLTILLSFYLSISLNSTDQKYHLLDKKINYLTERLDNQMLTMIDTHPPASGSNSYYTSLPEQELDTLINLTSQNGNCQNVSVQTCYVANDLGKGINLGDVFDAPWEGKWGVSFKEHYVDEIATHFNTVRIPVQWSNHAAKTADATLDEVFFERVEMVVDEFLNRGMYVVIDLHHYNQLNGNSPAEGAFWVDASVVEERFYNLWKQLSYKFKDKSEKLIFEIINEPNNKITSDKLNQMYPTILESIREHNPERTVMLMHAGYTFNSEEDLDTLIIPDDQNIIIDYHAYAPFKFTHQGLSYMPQNPAGVECCSIRQAHEIRAQIELFSSWSKKVGVPGFIGEFGSVINADEQSRIEYTEMVTKEIQRTGMGYAYWEFGSNFGLYDVATNTWRGDLIDSIINGNSEELTADKENLIQELTNRINSAKAQLGGAAWYRGKVAALALDLANGGVLTSDQLSRLAQLSRSVFHTKETLFERPSILSEINSLKRELTIDVFSAAELQSYANHQSISEQLVTEAKSSNDWATFQTENNENWANYSQEINSFGENRGYANDLYNQYIQNLNEALSKEWAKLRDSNLKINEFEKMMNTKNVDAYYRDNFDYANQLVEDVRFEEDYYRSKLKKLEKQFEELSF